MARQYNDKAKKDKRANNDIQKLHRKQKIEQNQSSRKPEVNLGASECVDSKLNENI